MTALISLHCVTLHVDVNFGILALAHHGTLQDDTTGRNEAAAAL